MYAPSKYRKASHIMLNPSLSPKATCLGGVKDEKTENTQNRLATILVICLKDKDFMAAFRTGIQKNNTK